MGELKKAVDVRYGGFKRWMEARDIKIKFDDTIWALALFGELYEQFSEEEKNAKLLARALDVMPIELLKEKITEREDKIKKQAEKMKQDGSPLHLADKKPTLVAPDGKPIASVMDHK